MRASKKWKRKGSDEELDTVALAKFLNGHVDEAIALQRRAIRNGGKSDDYRRRLAGALFR